MPLRQPSDMQEGVREGLLTVGKTGTVRREWCAVLFFKPCGLDSLWG
jgi:hypothetical protein